MVHIVEVCASLACVVASSVAHRRPQREWGVFWGSFVVVLNAEVPWLVAGAGFLLTAALTA